MGAGGRDTDKEAQGKQTPLPPAYQEKEPLPPDNPDPEAATVGDGHKPPVIVQNHPQCKKNKGFRCCLCCCGVLTVMILSSTVLPVIIVYLTRDFWSRPYVDITFQGSSSGVTSQTLKRGNDVTIKCHVDLSSRYVPLVQWFHDPNEDADDGARGYRMFGVHNQIHDPAYKGRFKVIKTETSAHQIVYSLKIKDLQPEDAGRYACQVPKLSRDGAGSVDEYQNRSKSSSSSSSSSEDRDGRGDDDKDHHDDDKRHGCWWSHRRNDYIYIGVTK